MKDFSQVVKNLPKKPGVYRFYNASGDLLYVGKAKDLKNRVSTYFQSARPKNERLMLMLNQIDRIEYTVVSSEKESLILEANLIHNLQPKYNVLLKDDKSYVYVRITNDPIPGIFLTRRKYDPKSKYFGPYTRQSGISATLRTLRTIFPYCQERFPGKRPCSYYGIKQCEGICAGLEDKDAYKARLNQIENVLRGKTEPVVSYLQTQIKKAIDMGNFELAALWRDRLKTLEDTIGTQKIILPHPQDLDLLTLVTQPNGSGLRVGSVFIQTIRDGKIVNVSNFLLSATDDNSSEADTDIEFSFLEKFTRSYYALQSDQAPVLIQTWQSENWETSEREVQSSLVHKFLSKDQKEVLEDLCGLKINLRNTYELNSAEISELTEQGKQNAFIYLQRNKLGQQLSLFEENNLFTNLVELQNVLGLPKIPRRIECYDISHLSGKFVYGSMVVFIDGRASKKDYRLFKTKEQNNDFENHREVLTRRFRNALQEIEDQNDIKKWALPDLIIVDGGKGQLSTDLAVLREFEGIFASKNTCFDVHICALAKQEEEIFIPTQPNPILLGGTTKFLVQRIRDEAHRFAITNNRKARLKTATKSALDDVDGIGSVTKNKLLSTFGSIPNIVKTLDTNQELLYELVGKKITEKLKKHFS